MELIDAVRTRHSVRSYTDRKIEGETLAKLNSAIEQANSDSKLHIQLVLDEPKAFSSGLLKYGSFTGVRNYLVMAGEQGPAAEEKVGYYGEKLVLLAQTLGLNTCWVGLTYKKVSSAYTLREGEKVHCVIAIGYGANQGVHHKEKPLEKFYEAPAPVPQWFIDGVKAALLAPTAVNQQKFKFILHDDGSVEAKALPSAVGYTNIDLGIVKCNFEIGAGKKVF